MKKKSGEVWRNVSFFRLFKRTQKWFQTIKYSKLVIKNQLNTHLYAAKRANAIGRHWRQSFLKAEFWLLWTCWWDSAQGRRIQQAVESSDVVQILAHNLQLPNVNNYNIQKFLLAQKEEQEQKQVKSEDKLFNIKSRLP